MICIVLNGHIKTVMSYTFKLYSKMFGFKLWCSQALIYSGITSGSCLCLLFLTLGSQQYLLGDSAFENYWFRVSAYKR